VNKEIFEFPLSYADPLPRICTGWGSYATAGDECKRAGIKKALIVTTGLQGTGVIDEIKSSLIYHGVATEVFSKVTSNPKDYEVMEAYRRLLETQSDGVVSIGGGSAHDCGKMARAVLANGGKPITDFVACLDPPWMEQIKQFQACTIPQIAIPTTAGTGAEITSLATLTNTKLRAKQLVLVPKIGPVTAIVDPLLMRLMPRTLAAWTGFDAFSHALETFISKVQSPYTYGTCLRGVQLISENLREFAFNRMNHIACERMTWASTTGGICMALGSGAGMVHGLAHQVSALTDCHHGLANAAMALAVESYNEPACLERFALLAGAMGVDTRNLSKIQAADKFLQEMERLLMDLEIQPGHLKDQFGLKKEDLSHIVKIFSNDFAREGNPRLFNYEETLQLLESVY